MATRPNGPAGANSARSSAQSMRGDRQDLVFLERMEGHLPRGFVRVMRRLPSAPRCRLCSAPFGGSGGRVMRRLGFGPSRKNPSLCNTCFEKAPMGGVEMTIGVLFADVRGFTALSERRSPDEVASLLNRFYSAAAEVLGRHAIIDKLVGDEVMALYLPQLLTERWGDDLVDDAAALLAAAGYGSSGRPWLQLGIGLDMGPAYVGNVGAGEVKDFTAVGDVVNTAARLQARAEAGQMVVSERLFGVLDQPHPEAVAGKLELKGKGEPQHVRTIDLR